MTRAPIRLSSVDEHITQHQHRYTDTKLLSRARVTEVDRAACISAKEPAPWPDPDIADGVYRVVQVCGDGGVQSVDDIRGAGEAPVEIDMRISLSLTSAQSDDFAVSMAAGSSALVGDVSPLNLVSPFYRIA